MAKGLRRLKITGAALGAALLVAALVLWAVLWLSLPPAEGRLALPGLNAPVTVARDAHGIPAITAASEADAYFALGVVHAQDRLWQMELHRRIGAGRLAELVGKQGLATDRFLRTLGIYRLAEQSYEQLEPRVRAAFDAYARGVNAWLEHHSGPLPPEFLALGIRPEPWRPADSLVWARLMGLQLAGNWREELQRQRLLSAAGAGAVQALWPGYPDGAPVTLAESTTASLLEQMPEAVRPRLASNVWVLDGSRTATGKPLLANDPHLGFQQPLQWYLARLDMPGLTLTGATVPGVPFHLLGHNGRIAWGITTTHSDTMDLFVEQPAGEGLYRTPEGPRPFVTRTETIRVRGGDAVSLTVRETRHGPVISDALSEPAADILALASAGLRADDRSAQAIYHLNRAQSWQQFTAALSTFHSPQQNFAYADTDGTIGFLVPGRVPVRRAGDGTLPRPGWDGAYDWTGWVPFDALPRLVNPPSGRIVNANNRVVPEDYPWLLTAHWPEPHRARRILDRLAGMERADSDAMQALLLDVVSPAAADLLPILLSAPAQSKRAGHAVALLAGWDGSMDRHRPEPLIFEAWMVAAQRALLARDMGVMDKSTAAAFALPRPLLLQQRLPGETALMAAALETALNDLAARHGADMAAWRWGDAHRARFRHMPFGHIPGLAGLFDIEIETDGGDFTINRGSYDPSQQDHPFRHVHGAGFRAVYDLSDLAQSRFMIATGQSGHVLSPHYGDLVEDWRDGRMVRIGGESLSRLILEPFADKGPSGP